jgi:hypothetical protein
MSDWISYDRWAECIQMERPGFVFEVKNAEGQSLFTTCTVPLQLPFDWKTPPLYFRLVSAPPERRSGPTPQPPKQR